MNTCRSKAETVLREFVKKVQLMRFAQNQCSMSDSKSGTWFDEKVKRELEVDQFIKEHDFHKTSIDDWI